MCPKGRHSIQPSQATPAGASLRLTGVEPVSPVNKTMDRKVKPLLYAEAAIPHFWRLEFEPPPRLIVSELDGGRYVERTTALAGTTAHIEVPFPLDPATLTRR